MKADPLREPGPCWLFFYLPATAPALERSGQTL